MQNTFASGEFAPELYARVDTEAYQSAVAYSNNFLPSDRGPITRRAGTVGFDYVWDNTRTYKLVRFTLRPTQQYILVFCSDDTMRIIDVGAKAWVLSGGSPFSLSLGGIMDTPDKVNNFTSAQSGRVLFLARADMYPTRLVYTAPTTWNVGRVALTDGPYESLENKTITLTPNNTTPSAVTQLTASAAVFDATRDAGDVIGGKFGRLIRIANQAETDWVCYQVTSVVSPTVVNVTVLVISGVAFTLPASGIARWRFSLWYKDNYPEAASVFEDRLTYGGYPLTSPEATTPSTTSGFTPDSARFSPTALTGNTIGDSEAFVRSPANADLGAGVLQWLAPGTKELYIGTTTGIYALGTRSGAGAFGPLTSELVRVANHRCSSVTPQIDGDNLIIVELGGRRPIRVKANSSGLTQNSSSREVSFFSPHLFYNTAIVASFRTFFPYPLLWFILADGTLLSVAYTQGENDSTSISFVGMFRYELGGASIKQAEALYDFNTTSEAVWMLVERDVGGTTRQVIEFLPMETGLTNPDLIHLDYKKTVAGTGDTITDTFYASKTVGVVIDGADAGTVTASAGGLITLPYAPTTSVTFGFPFTSELWTLPPVQPSPTTGLSVVGAPITISSVELVLLNSLDVECGKVDLNIPNPTPTYTLGRPFQSSTGSTYDRPPLFSGRYKATVSAGGGDSVAPALCFRTSKAYPLTISAIKTEYSTSLS